MKIHLLVCVSLTFILINSCENELDLIAPRKDIPIVYAVLCPTDTAQFVRLERAFVDRQVPAEELAIIPDSFYYPSAIVKIIRNNTSESYILSRIDGNLEGYQREDGIFSGTPNYLYKFKSADFPLVSGEIYELQINRSEESELVFAKTTIPKAPLITRPSSTSSIDMDYTTDYIVKWKGGEEAVSYDLNMLIHIREYQASHPGMNEEIKTLKWGIRQNIENEESGIPGIHFYNFLADQLTEDPSKERILDHLDIQVQSSSRELFDYTRVGQANLGITSSQEIPIFTNLSEGYGIFASKNTGLRQDLKLTSKSLDSLRSGQFTKLLNFQ